MKKIKYFIVLVFLCMPSAHADLVDEFQLLFNDSLVHSNSPSDIIKNGHKSGKTFGSFRIRNQQSRNVNLLSFRPPGFNAGCNGIDMWGGSFAFIDSDALIGALRNVGSAALTYAFQTAVNSMCSSCYQLMEALQNKVEELNQSLKDSCELGKKLGDLVPDDLLEVDGVNDAVESYAKEINSWDWNVRGIIEQKFGEAAECSPIDNNVQKDATGSIVYKIFSGSSFSVGLGNVGFNNLSDDTTILLLQSLMGSYLAVLDQSGCASNNGGVTKTHLENPSTMIPIPPSLTVAELINGVSPDSEKLLACTDDQVTCMPIAYTRLPANISRGLLSVVKAMYMGDYTCLIPNYTNCQTMSMRYRKKSEAYTPAQNALLGIAGEQLVTFVRDQAKKRYASHYSMDKELEEFDKISQRLVWNILENLFADLDHALNVLLQSTKRGIRGQKVTTNFDEKTVTKIREGFEHLLVQLQQYKDSYYREKALEAAVEKTKKELKKGSE